MPETAFSPFEIESGKLFDDSDGAFPTRLYAWTPEKAPALHQEGRYTVFGFVFRGPARLDAAHNSYHLGTGQYFSIPEPMTLTGGEGILVERLGYVGLSSIGGPIESSGRLRYIDGCTDTLLVPPVRFGDPCLNALYFPPGIDQTDHTHPSIRVGLIARGRGECVTPEGVYPLRPGTIFVIHQDGHHKFRTAEESMVVIAYHPDSDFGPRDEDHPMINRTLVAGRSAAEIDEIRTR